MVIDNIWKQGKISETIYKYVQVCYLLPTDYKLIFWTSGGRSLFTLMHCCKRVWKLPYTRLCRSSSIAATLSTMACLSSWIVMIRLRNTRSFRNPHREKYGTVSLGDWSGQAMSPKIWTQVTRCYTFRRSIATDHMKWRPVLYRSPSCQPRQAIAPAQYSNLKCVSRLHTTLYEQHIFVHCVTWASTWTSSVFLKMEAICSSEMMEQTELTTQCRNPKFLTKGCHHALTNQNSIQEEFKSRLKSGNAFIVRCRMFCVPICYPKI